MLEITEDDKLKVKDLRREAFLILSDVNEMEITFSRIKNEATELIDKCSKILNKEDGNKT